MAWRLYQDSRSDSTVEIRRNPDGTYDLDKYDNIDGDHVLVDWVLDVGRDEGPQTFEDMVDVADAQLDVALEELPIDGDCEWKSLQ
jgi:hypothetical protein